MLPPQYSSEPPPAYTSQVFLRGSLQIKCEKQFSRRWATHEAELNNTVLRLHKRGRTRSLSLQNAQVGFAADYTKGNYPVRLIAPDAQLLLEFDDKTRAMQWLDALQQSINIALPLDLRQEPPVPRLAGASHKEACISDFAVLLGGLRASIEDIMY